ELSPSLVQYDALEPMSVDVASESVGLKTLATHTSSANVSCTQFCKPIVNLYQTDPTSRASVTMAGYTHGRASRVLGVVTGRVCITPQRPR
ncbi:hypothetical protein EI94DRAFT_1716584, partial [Lactarius quietus]